jgi:hypothetical protein
MGCTTCTEPQCLYKGAIYLTFIPQAENGIAREKESMMFVMEPLRRLFGCNRQEHMEGGGVVA